MSAVEFEQARNMFFDEVDLDHAYLRQCLALHDAYQRRVRRIGALWKAQRPVTGIGFQHNARAAPPLPQSVRASAHCSRANVPARGLDHLAGDGSIGEVVSDDRVVRLLQTELERV